MKRVLIISNYYKHKNSMASVRAIKLAKYLDRAGYDVSVLTSMQRDGWSYSMNEPEASKTIHEYYAPEAGAVNKLYSLQSKIHKRGVKRLAAAASSGGGEKIQETEKTVPQRVSLKKKIRAFVSWSYYFLFDYFENRILYKSLVHKIKNQKLYDFDCVIATYPGSGAHRTGVWMKKHKKCKSFIADFRDPQYNPGARGKKIEAYMDKRLQDKTVRVADKIVCVSYGMADEIKNQYQGKKIPQIFVVHNGFDMEDYENIDIFEKKDGKFSFAYTGTLYHGRRTVDALAKVVARLVEEGEVLREKISFEYAGPDFETLKEQLALYGLEDTAQNFGVVSRNESFSLQKNADAVLLLNWNDENYKGVIPGKIYEYMASGKPIIALIMGNASGSESAKMIRESHLGVAFESADETSEMELYEYIKNLLKKGENKEHNLQNIEFYNYKNIAQRYSEIIEK